ncbi:hypothetical protein CLV60_12215 [Dyadobacter jiangsuensis]|uniref:Uncharacterized protein n=1 Tax=Dyadobacter jiangsuensis TaxID=1591085 RepID=A0A2P8FI51_9BACT|nr:hypothetical protein CLV60_12215 [Dyadobacter jiangsuensis]
MPLCAMVYYNRFFSFATNFKWSVKSIGFVPFVSGVHGLNKFKAIQDWFETELSNNLNCLKSERNLQLHMQL